MIGKRWTGAFAGLVLAWAASFPAAAQETGFYLGGAFGQTKSKGFCSDVTDVTVFFFGGSVQSCDEKDNGFKIFGGYRVNRNFAVEGSYFDYGEFPARITVGGNSGTLTGEATAWGVAAVGLLPVSDRFSLFGKAGLLFTDLSVTAVGPGGVGVGDDEGSGLHFGVGGMFNLAGNIAIRAEWERNDEADIDMMSIGVQVRF